MLIEKGANYLNVYSGVRCQVIGCASYSKADIQDIPHYCLAELTDNSDTVPIYRNKDILFNNFFREVDLVVYVAEGEIRARELSEFIGGRYIKVD